MVALYCCHFIHLGLESFLQLLDHCVLLFKLFLLLLHLDIQVFDTLLVSVDLSLELRLGSVTVGYLGRRNLRLLSLFGDADVSLQFGIVLFFLLELLLDFIQLLLLSLLQLLGGRKLSLLSFNLFLLLLQVLR